MSAHGPALMRLRDRLEHAGCETENRADGFMAQCPVHDDRSPSLHVSAGRDRALVCCHGCGASGSEVADALALPVAALFDEWQGEFGAVPQLARKAQPRERSAKTTRSRRPQGDPEAIYPYLDESGDVLFQVVRFPGKDFRQRRPSGDGGWTWRLNGVRRVPYRLPELLAAARDGRTVYIAEGEKDVAAIERAGGAATCNPGGAGKWNAEYAEHLRGADVVVVADTDQPGRDHARQVAATLEGVATSVAVVEPAAGKDAADHLAAGKRLDEFVTGGAVPLDEIVTFMRRYMVLPSDEAADALALFVAHTHAIEAASATPYLLILSPEPGSGKTRLLEVLELIAARAERVANLSEAAMFRLIDKKRPTLLYDEVDRLYGGVKSEKTEAQTQILNAGNRRGSQTYRCAGSNRDELTPFSVFCPKVLAGLDTPKGLPDTITDRAIELRLQKKAPGERVERFKLKIASAEAEPLHDALAAWAASNTPLLEDATPAEPEALTDRMADAWEPVLAIADLAGGDWPERARRAAVALSGQRADSDDIRPGTRLLRDIRAVFEKKGTSTIWSATLCEELRAMELAPWATWGKSGDGLNERTLNYLLKPYRTAENTPIKAKQVRIGDLNRRGFERAQFEDAWRRYDSDSPYPPAPECYTATSQAGSGIEPPPAVLQGGDGVADKSARDPAPDAGCSAVALTTGGVGLNAANGNGNGHPGDAELRARAAAGATLDQLMDEAGWRR